MEQKVILKIKQNIHLMKIIVLSFQQEENRELEMTEFYNLVYQYENDCLKAAIEYNKNFYSDTILNQRKNYYLH